MLSDFMKRALRREVTAQLVQARRELRKQEQRLARLKYEWGIAKRMRSQARNEEEREKWRVQCDAHMGLILQQESVVEEIQASIDRHQTRLAELDAQLTGEAKQ